MGPAKPVAAILAFACVLSSVGAAAHVTAQPNEAAAGAHFKTAFSVSHGCEGAATIAVRIKIPHGVTGVKPQFKPGWEITISQRKLDRPLEVGHGRTIQETVDEVAWRGGPLPDSMYDTFGLVMKLPDAPNQTLYFPLVQECERGVHRWIGIPAAGQKWNDVREPAPFVRIRPAR